MVEELQDQKQSEELQRKAEEVRQKAFLEEAGRLDAETTERAQELLHNLQVKEKQIAQQKLNQARAERQQQENTLSKLEEEYRIKLEAELQKIIEGNQRAEDDRRKAEEELAREKAEEDERRKREEEIHRLEEERRLKDADEERRREEQQHRLELEQQQREEERRRLDEERQQRIATLIDNAKDYYAVGNREHALVEIAKALVNDPTNTSALELEAKIKGETGEAAPSGTETIPEKPKVQRRVHKQTVETAAPEKKHSTLTYVLGIIVILIIAGVVIIFQIKKHAFKLPATIAVLPWTGTSSSIEENILGSSIAEEVAHRLGSTKTIFVLGFPSGYNLTTLTKEPNREAFRSGYTYILQGRVSRSDNSITIDLKLIDSLGNEGWTGRYVKPISGLSGLPADITKQLVEALGVETDDISSGFVSPITSTNSDAYQFYLRGRELLQRRTSESSENAYLLFLQAIQQDPKFADGLAAAADVLAFRLENGWSRGDSVVIQSKHLAEAAIRANPLLDMGYVALGKILAFQKSYITALSYLDSALTLAPNNSIINLERGKIFAKVGKYSDAINSFREAYKYNGADPELLQNIAFVYQLAGSPKQGMPYLEAALKYVPDPLMFLAVTLSDAISGDPDLRLNQSNRIIAASYRRINMNSQDYITLYHLARLRQIMGDTDAVEILNKTSMVLQDESRKHQKDAHILMYLALTLTRLGRYSEAIAIADKATALDPLDDIVKYRIAQVYSLQMYVQKEKKLDEKKKDISLKYLHDALALNYRLDEVTSADFYNMYDRLEFRATIQEPLK